MFKARTSDLSAGVYFARLPPWASHLRSGQLGFPARMARFFKLSTFAEAMCMCMQADTSHFCTACQVEDEILVLSNLFVWSGRTAWADLHDEDGGSGFNAIRSKLANLRMPPSISSSIYVSLLQIFTYILERYSFLRRMRPLHLPLPWPFPLHVRNLAPNLQQVPRQRLLVQRRKHAEQVSACVPFSCCNFHMSHFTSGVFCCFTWPFLFIPSFF